MIFKSIVRHPLFKTGLVYTFCDAINKAVPFLILPILSYYLAPGDYGILANFNVLLAMLTILVTAGTDAAISITFYRVTKEDLSKYIFNSLILVALSTILLLGMILFFQDIIYSWTKVPLKYQLSLILMSVAALFTSINLTLWRLEEKPLKFGLYDILQTAVNLGLSLFFVAHMHLNWIGRVNGMFIAFVSFGFFSFFMLIKRGYLKFSFDKPLLISIALFGIPLIPHSLSFWIRSGIDRIFITNFIGESANGLYATGFQFGILVSFLIISFNNAFSPFLYKLLSESDPVLLMINKIKLVKITYIVALILLILSIIFLITSNFILLHFFEKSYSDANKYILWAIISQTFQGFYLLFVNYILFSKKTKLLASITFSCSLLQVVLSFFLIKYLGAIGGAYSTVIVSFINFLIVAFVSQKVYSMPWFKVLTELKSFFKEPKFVQ